MLTPTQLCSSHHEITQCMNSMITLFQSEKNIAENFIICCFTGFSPSKVHSFGPNSSLEIQAIVFVTIKQRIEYKLGLLTYKTLTNQQPTYLYNSLSFPSHYSCFYKIFWFTRSFHPICQIITWQKGVLCHDLVNDYGIHSLLISEIRILYLRGRGGERQKMKEYFLEASAWGLFVRRFPEISGDFGDFFSGDFGLSFRLARTK